MADTKLEELLKDCDVSIRQISFDRLVQLDEIELQNREGVLVATLEQFRERIAILKKRVEADEQILTFLAVEYDQVTTALRVKRDELVRIVCPACKGTGLRSADALSGKIRGTAFEGTGSGGSSIIQTVEIDPANACSACEGKRWQLMLRFKG